MPYQRSWWEKRLVILKKIIPYSQGGTVPNKLRVSCSRHREPGMVRRPVISCGRMGRGHEGRSQRKEVATWVLFRHHLSHGIPEILPRAHCGRFILSGALITFLTGCFLSGFTRYTKTLGKEPLGHKEHCCCLTDCPSAGS